MNDRELLKAAAKAAGVAPLWWLDSPDSAPYYGTIPHHSTWNPLADDGDALRLAVKLSIDITFNEMDVMAWASGLDGEGEPRNVDDPGAAARLVIVRAAAAIGGTP